MKDRHRRQSGRGRARMEGTLAMGRARALAILSLSIAGVVISSYLIYADHRLGRDPAWESLCTVSERFDCNAAIRSPYSSIFGVPLSVLAACFYMLTALLAAVDLWAPRRTWPRSPAILLLLGSSIACVWSVGLAGVSAFAVRSWCLLCIALYVVNFCMLLVAVSALRATKETIRFSLSSERARLTKHPFPAVACVIVASVVLVAVRNNRSESARLSVACEEAALAAREGRPLELVVYSDFQCPHCKALDASLRQLRRRPLVRIVQEPYPLDQACNPHARITRHPGACLQALASLCADEQGRGQAFNDRLFDEGAKERATLAASAASLGIDRGRFEACLQSPAVAARLRDVIDGAAARQVRATPTLFVNGRRHDGAVRPSDLSCLLSVPDRPSRNTVPPR